MAQNSYNPIPIGYGVPVPMTNEQEMRHAKFAENLERDLITPISGKVPITNGNIFMYKASLPQCCLALKRYWLYVNSINTPEAQYFSSWMISYGIRQIWGQMRNLTMADKYIYKLFNGSYPSNNEQHGMMQRVKNSDLPVILRRLNHLIKSWFIDGGYTSNNVVHIRYIFNIVQNILYNQDVFNAMIACCKIVTPRYKPRLQQNTKETGEKYPQETGEEYPEETGEEYPEETGEEYPEETGEEYPQETGEEYPQETGENDCEEDVKDE